MSIINQTLRDLDARRTNGVSPGAGFQPVAAARGRRTALWVAAATLLSMAGLLVWVLSRPVGSISPLQADNASHTVAPPAANLAAKALHAPPAGTPEQAAASAQPEILPAVGPVNLSEALMLKLSAPDNASTAAGMAMKTGIPAASGQPPVIQKQANPPSAEEEADERYRKAGMLVQKGRENQARPLLEEAIRLFPGHIAAHQSLATLLSEAGQNRDAEAVLREARSVAPDDAWFALNLARLQAARGDLEGAAATLLSGLEGRGVNAEYHATLAALHVRLRQHPEAARQYEQALRLQPEQGTWWMGLGLSMEAQGKTDEARSAYGRALTTGNLPEKLTEFVRAKLVELKF